LGFTVSHSPWSGSSNETSPELEYSVFWILLLLWLEVDGLDKCGVELDFVFIGLDDEEVVLVVGVGLVFDFLMDVEVVVEFGFGVILFDVEEGTEVGGVYYKFIRIIYVKKYGYKDRNKLILKFIHQRIINCSI